MNDPIINPWVFYLISLCDKVSMASATVATVIVALAMFLTIVLVADGYQVDESILKTVVILYAVGGVSALLAVFVPSGTTVTAMVAANNITPETVAAVGQTVTESAETISPSSAFPSATEVLVFPTAVGPARMMSGLFAMLIFIACFLSVAGGLPAAHLT